MLYAGIREEEGKHEQNHPASAGYPADRAIPGVRHQRQIPQATRAIGLHPGQRNPRLRYPQDQGGNAKAGFTNPAADSTTTQTPYAGQWVAKNDAGATVATIRIDAKEQVWVNGKRVDAKRTDGTLQFHQGKLTFTIQGDRRLTGEDYWTDSDAGTKGPIEIE